MKKKVEILAQAGSFDRMKAAVSAGADAVYMGGSRFGARAYAENPDETGMLEAINYVHLHGRQLYMTVNTLVKEDEMDDLYDYLLPYYQAGLVAVIVQDMGVFSYIREFMLPSVGKLLEKVDNWCCIHGMNVEIVVNDWAVAEMLHGKTSHLCPVFGTLLNKRKKDPRMKYKSGDISLFQQNSLNAEFYRDFLAEEFHIHRYEWESCGYPQEFPPGKNSLHLPFYQTNTSQYCPLYALCTTGDRGTQQLAEHCPKFCEKYALLYPEHLHMMGRYNSLFGVDKTFLESPEMWKKIKGIKPDRIVVNL